MHLETPRFYLPNSTTVDACRACAASDLDPVLDFGTTPIADRLVPCNQPYGAEPLQSLSLVRCPSCSLVQITETVEPEELFCRDYPYYTSVSPSLVEHFSGIAKRLISLFHLGPRSLVVEAGSNDGCMLRAFRQAGVPALGVDPAAGPVDRARRSGHEVVQDFFSSDLAQSIATSRGRADLFIANNVLAHVADLNGFVAGVALLLAAPGTAVFEVPYLCDLIAKCAFDTVYHQHLCYFSLTALTKLFDQHGLCLNHAEPLEVQGGSLRLFVSRQRHASEGVTALLREEQAKGICGPAYYADFARRVPQLCDGLRHTLDRIASAGRTVAGYGAAAKATTMISYCDMDADTIQYIVDLNEQKWNHRMAGTGIPIHPPARLMEDNPDYLLLFAWNFAQEIARQNADYRGGGGRFITPLPEVLIW